MKRVLLIIILCLMLMGCSQKTDYVDNAMGLRSRLSNAQSCSFNARVTADYGDCVYTFRIQCEHQNDGGMQWEILEPDSIQGIAGMVTEKDGKFVFDDGNAVIFPLLADGYITPAAVPWILTRTILGGYIQKAGPDNEYIRTQIDDSFKGRQFTLDLWTDSSGDPVRGDILWEGQRIMSIEITDFVIS